MDSLTHETEIKIFKYLLEIGCCINCCLRLISVHNPEYYENPIETSQKLKYIEESFEISEESPCIACLGILQENVKHQVLEQVTKVITSEANDSPTFTCALSVPMSLTLREKSLDISIRQNLDLPPNDLAHLFLKIESIKDVWKIQMLPRIEAAISKRSISGPTPSPFLIDISLIHDRDESDYEYLLKKCDPNFHERRNRNVKYSRNNIEKVLSTIDKEKFAEFFAIPPGKPMGPIVLDKISCSHAGVFIGGRYNKLSRELSQTPWFINGEKKMESSVQELLCGPLIEATRADSLKFLSSGREDVDVRTINSGRPFAVELINPRRTIIADDEMKTISERINSSTELVQVTSNLKFLDAGHLKTLKDGENKKSKFYRALCTVKDESKKGMMDLGKLEGMRNVKIIQKTPVRVLHRRPLAARVKMLYRMRGRRLTKKETEELRKNTPDDLLDNLFVLDIKTQAGTYVKEFVHGDFGRTKPSLCDLLGEEVDIVALDVTGINLHWP
ncbi:putative tRNA pseudouridine synthase Pus10 [Diachasma alloeum]|uniref:putative tRNA pseudouridine synthase Pus10 n=1 Tax=Diachasma alloeum TaxID=454923 RepID=UPI0007383C7A|nr:putative tRNA pseudouridine synthase Pus10 [Diachasma alloeum]